MPGEGPGRAVSDGEALAADLGRFAAGEPVSVRCGRGGRAGGEVGAAKPTLAAAYTLGLLAVLLGGLGGAARGSGGLPNVLGRRRRTTGQGERRPSEAETARGLEAKARAEAERQREKFAPVRIRADDPGRPPGVAGEQRRRHLALLDGTRADLRGWEWRYVHRLCHSDLLTLKGHTDNVTSASFSPDGTRVVTAVRQDGEGLGRQSGAGSSHSKGTPVTSIRRRSARTGRGSSPRVMTRRRRSGTRRVAPRSSRSRGTPVSVDSAAFSPDGSRIVTASRDKTAKVWDAKSGAEILTLKGHTDRVTSASFSPDGSRIVTASVDKTAKVWDAKSGAEVLTLKGHTGLGSFGVVQPGRVADRHRE